MVYNCYDCALMDLKDSCRYDRSQYYCSYFRKYYKPDSRACRHAVPRRYVTSCICDILNIKENEEYFNTFDNVCTYMEENEEYSKLLEVYDITGPIVSSCLYNSLNSKEVAKIALEVGIKPAYNKAKEGKIDEAINTYIEMMINLEKLYGIETTYNIDKPKVRSKN